MSVRVFALHSLAICLHGRVGAEIVEMTTGPDLSISYESSVWKPLAPVRAAGSGSSQLMTWALQSAEWTQVTVASYPDRKAEEAFKRETLEVQKFRGDPAELIAERKEIWARRRWLVLEFGNSHTRPPRSEIHYFHPTVDGYVHVFVIGEEASLPKHQKAINAFIDKVQLK